jgi:hypothetical protein
MIVAASLGPSFGHLSGIPTLFELSFIHGNLQQETTGHLTEESKNTTFSGAFFKGPKKNPDFWVGFYEFSLFRQAAHGQLRARFDQCLRFRARSPIESTILAKCSCSLVAGYFRMLAMSKRAFTGSHLP